MTIKQLKTLIADINDDVQIDVEIPAFVDPVWHGITGLDTSADSANEFGQVLITLTKSPTME